MPEITTIGPSLRIPEVPNLPRMSGVAEAIGGGLSDLAHGLGNVIELARSTSKLAQAAGEAHRQMREAVGEADTDPDTDFDAVGERFVARTQQVRENLRPQLTDPGEAQAFDDDTAQMQQAYARSVKRRAFERAKPTARSQLGEVLDGLSRDAADAGDADAERAVTNVAARHIDRHVKSGWITPEEGDQLKKRFRGKAQEEYLRKQAEADPGAARKLLQEGAAPDIDPAAQEQLDAEFADSGRLRAASNDAELRKGLEDLVKQVNEEALPSAEQVAGLQSMAEASGDPNAIAAASAAGVGLGFAQRLGRLPPAEAMARLEALRTSDKNSPERDAALAFGSGMVKQMQQRLATDPIGFAQDQGLVDAQPLDWNSATPEAIATRAKTARMVAQFYGLEKPVFLTGNERQSMAQAFKDAAPDRKEALMQSTITGFGAEDASRMFRDLGGIAQAEAHLAALAAWGGGRKDIAARGFVGQKALDDKAVTLPADAELGVVEAETIGSLFDARLSQSRASVIAGGRALYAERAVNRGIVGLDAAEYAKALNEAAGATPQGGGIHKRNGRPVMLPMDMTPTQFDSALDTVTDAELAAAAVGKNPPAHVTLTGKVMPATAEDVKKAVLVQSAYGRYRVSMTDPAAGPAQYLVDAKTGGYYELDMGDPAVRPETAVYQPGARYVGAGHYVKRVKVKPPKDQSRVPEPPPVAPTSQKDQSRIAPSDVADVTPAKDQTRILPIETP
jgi:hypothetical protein